MPKVSVVLPTYNGSFFLAEAIESVLAQTWKDFELIIIDDASTDNTATIASQYVDPRIRIIQNPHNLRLVDTLNKGIALAQGPYIARMDQDDISLPKRLEQQVAFMDSHPEVGICGSWIEVFGFRNYIERYPSNSNEIKAKLFVQNQLAHPSVMLRKEHLDAYGLRYDPAFQYVEDYDLWQRASRHFGLCNLPQVLLRYRTSVSSICRTHSAEQQSAIVRMDCRNLAELGLQPTDDQVLVMTALRNEELFLRMNHESRKSAQVFLTSILEANYRRQIYPVKEFEAVIRQCQMRLSGMHGSYHRAIALLKIFKRRYLDTIV